MEQLIKDFLVPNPALSHRFSVVFFRGGHIPYVTDFAFQRVSGINAEVQLETINEGGQNLYSHRLPDKISYSNLVLERGYALASPLTLEFLNTFSRYQFIPSKVLVMLHDATGIPIGAWNFEKVYPVKWSLSDFDAQDSKVLVDSMELAYTRYQALTF